MTTRPFIAQSRRAALALLLLGVVCGGACTLPPYQPGAASQYHPAPEPQAASDCKADGQADCQIERGEYRPLLDALGWVVGLPGKIILWDHRIDNHDISCETEEALAEYLASNELTTVKVRLNQYAPCDEWRRLRANKSMAWGWRYSLGTVTWLGYTLLPGRVFGGDAYNPYTNTIYVYSDVPAIALHEGGHARYWAERQYKGNHAAVYALVPGAALYYEAVATGDALAYLHDFGSAADERDGYEILYPAYGTYVGGLLSPGLLELAPVVAGHVVGRLESRKIEDHPSAVSLAPIELSAAPPPDAPLRSTSFQPMLYDPALN